MKTNGTVSDSSTLILPAYAQVLGAFIDCKWIRKEGFLGGRECFLFTITPQLKCYPYRENELPNILLVDNTAITFGLTKYDCFFVFLFVARCVLFIYFICLFISLIYLFYLFVCLFVCLFV
jgi:hypothetical protein